MSIPMNCRVNELFENRPSGCEWHINNEIGRGQQGIVYSACCNNKKVCDYAAKVYQQIDEDRFQNEVSIHYDLDEIGIAVHIVEAFYCQDHGAYIIMNRLDKTVPQYIMKLLDDGKNDDFIKNKIEQIKNECINMLIIARDNNIVQTDPNINNFMMNMDGDNYTDLYMIDFGLAKRINDNDISRYTDEKIRVDMEMTINLLIKNYEEKRNQKERGYQSFREPPQIMKYKKKRLESTYSSSDNSKKIKMNDREYTPLSFESIDETPASSSSLAFESIDESPLVNTTNAQSSRAQAFRSLSSEFESLGGHRRK
jgi:tRNA A-37 threonylcarbamoyl transferase component Bud32